MKYYIAYGSNLNKAQMARRCKYASPVGSAILSGLKLVFRRGYLTIERDDDGFVPVGIWQIMDSDELALDRYEGFPHFYRKETLPVSFMDASGAMHVDEPCMVYIMNDGYDIQRGSREYLQTCAQGYRDFGFGLLPLMDADLEAAGA